MTLPSSGALSMSAINAEFGRGNNLNSYRGTTWYTDAGASGTFSSGAISFNEFYGKRATSPTFSFSIASNQTNANLRSLAVAAGWNQSSAVIATVNAGVWIYSTSTGTPGLTINGSFPGGVTLINNGNIIGMGGQGGGNGLATAGGNAISLGVSVSITNNSYIAGGGGGGGGSASGNNISSCGGGGGAGGGSGGAVGTLGGAGAGGGLGSSGGNGSSFSYAAGKSTVISGGGGGGGRILPGTGGANSTYGGSTASNFGRGGGSGGGGGGSTGYSGAVGYSGGSGGNAGTSVPFNDSRAFWSASGGGGWGASGGTTNYGPGTYVFNGGAGGKCVALNGYSVTWNATGTRYGAIS